MHCSSGVATESAERLHDERHITDCVRQIGFMSRDTDSRIPRGNVVDMKWPTDTDYKSEDRVDL